MRTKREQLVEEIIKAENEINTMLAEPKYACAEDRRYILYMRTGSRGYKVYELKDILECRQREIERIKEQQQLDAFWATGEGAELRRKIDAAKNCLGMRFEEIRRRWQDAFGLFITTAVNKFWACVYAEENCARFVKKDAQGKDIFGTEIDMYFRPEHWGEMPSKVELNFGTMGCFGINSERAEFYKDVAKLLEASSEKRLLDLQNYYLGLYKNEKKEAKRLEEIESDPKGYLESVANDINR